MTVMVAWLWQGTAIAAGTALFLRLARRQSAATRYLVWWIALVAVVLLPVAHLRQTSSASSGSASAVLPASLDRALVLPAPPDWLVACLLGAWLGMVLVGVGRLAHGMLAVLRLRQRARPVEAHVVRSLDAWRDYSKNRRPATICQGRNVPAASAVGLFGRPTIVLSESLIDSLDRPALDQVVLHEQAHLSRYDDWTRLLQALLSAVCGLHPAVRFITGRLDLEREAACDAIVVARTGNAARYAACLADVADTMGRSTNLREWSAAPGALGSGALLVRVRRLLDPRQTPVVGVGRFDATVTGLLLLATVLAAPSATPVLVLESRQRLPMAQQPPSTLQAWRATPDAITPASLPVDEPVFLVASASFSQPTGRSTRTTARTDDGLRWRHGPQAMTDARFAPESGLPRQESPSRDEPEPLASRPLAVHSLAQPLDRVVNDSPPSDNQNGNRSVDAIVPALSDWSAIGDASVALGRKVGRLSTSTGNGTRRASVAVGG